VWTFSALAALRASFDSDFENKSIREQMCAFSDILLRYLCKSFSARASLIPFSMRYYLVSASDDIPLTLGLYTYSTLSYCIFLIPKLNSKS